MTVTLKSSIKFLAHDNPPNDPPMIQTLFRALLLVPHRAHNLLTPCIMYNSTSNTSSTTREHKHASLKVVIRAIIQTFAHARRRILPIDVSVDLHACP
mmetsp:Transcript_40014/g.125708  ORF Transcript_40014/g.125708 Transcript_40014/m.125708 type:complete len:98 (-) Transcript_40014:332-625(-)